MTLNMEDQAGDLQSRTGEAIENVEDFIYLGSWIDGTERDIEVRKAKAWAALQGYKTSGNPNSLKALRSDCSLRLVSQCCCTAQKHGHCMTKAQEKSLDGTYTKMLRMVLGVTWKDKVSNAVLYGKLPRLKAFRQYRN